MATGGEVAGGVLEAADLLGLGGEGEEGVEGQEDERELAGTNLSAVNRPAKTTKKVITIRRFVVLLFVTYCSLWLAYRTVTCIVVQLHLSATYIA